MAPTSSQNCTILRTNLGVNEKAPMGMEARTSLHFAVDALHRNVRLKHACAALVLAAHQIRSPLFVMARYQALVYGNDGPLGNHTQFPHCPDMPASMALEHSCSLSGTILDAYCLCHSGMGQNDPIPPASVLAFRVAAMTDATLRFRTTPFIMAPWNSLVPYRVLYLSDNGAHGRPTSMASAIRPYAVRLCRQVRLRRLLLEITSRLERSLIDLFRPGSRP